MMKSNIFVVRAAGLALVGAFWLAPGASWALPSCSDAAYQAADPATRGACLGGSAGTLSLVTSPDRKGVNQWEFSDGTTQAIETKGKDCQPEGGSLVSYSADIGFYSTLGDYGTASGQDCGEVDGDVTFFYESNRVATYSTLDLEAKGTIEGSIVLASGPDAADVEGTILLRGGSAGGGAPFIFDDENVYDIAACPGGIYEALTVDNADTPSEPWDGDPNTPDGIIVDATTVFPVCVNLRVGSDSGRDNTFNDHANIEHNIVHDRMTINMTQGTLGLDGGQTGDFVGAGSVFEMAQIFAGILDCGDDAEVGSISSSADGLAYVVRLPNDEINSGVSECGCVPAPFNLSLLEDGVQLDLDVTSNGQQCAALKFEVLTPIQTIDAPVGGTPTKDPVTEEDLFGDTATSTYDLFKFIQKFKFPEVDPAYYLDICPLSKLYEGDDPDGILPLGPLPNVNRLPHENVDDIDVKPTDFGGVGIDGDTIPDSMAGMCFKDGFGNCQPPAGRLADMQNGAGDGLQFGCYTEYQVIHEPLGVPNTYQIRALGWILGDWTLSKPSFQR